jgi:hypothetical protein
VDLEFGMLYCKTVDLEFGMLYCKTVDLEFGMLYCKTVPVRLRLSIFRENWLPQCSW